MKKIFALLMMFALLMTGCGGSPSGDGKKYPGNEIIRLGILRHMNVTETLLDEYFEKVASRMSQTSDMRAPKHVFFDNMTSMLAALQAGKIDELSTYKCVANYLVANNPNCEELKGRVPRISDSFCCAMLEENSALKKEFDDAILKLKADDTLKQLVKTYVTEADHTVAPPVVAMPKIDGAPTIKIAVTGDLPPLDFVSTDGKPAGFNTAVLAEISRLIGKNFELVQVDSGARAVALTSKEVDVVFWAIVPEGVSVPSDIDKPDGIILTEPYFSDEVAHVKLKK